MQTLHHVHKKNVWHSKTCERVWIVVLQAEAPGYEDEGDANYTQYRIYNPSGSAYLSARYSPSGSFVQIEPIREKLALGSTQNLQLFFTSDDPNAAENTDFNFVVSYVAVNAWILTHRHLLVKNTNRIL